MVVNLEINGTVAKWKFPAFIRCTQMKEITRTSSLGSLLSHDVTFYDFMFKKK